MLVPINYKGIQMTRILSEKEASAITGFSIYWFRRKRWQGGGPLFRKFGRKVGYPESELLKWINSHELHNSTSEYRII